MKIKFTGKFKDLKPMGFKFHKLFANNYKVYEKNDIWIWVANGGYVEIKDFYNNSGYIAELILNDTYPKREKDSVFKGKLLFKKGDPLPCLMERETGEIIPRKSTFDIDYDKYKSVLILDRWIKTINEIRNMIEIIK